MKHCHITILYNEIGFLQHKVPFLYSLFDQLIFVDYNVLTGENSNDGSLEYLKNYPDVENKMIIIDNFDPTTINTFYGKSNIIKRKMFAKASQYINEDIDVVWATDADEFFTFELFEAVEKTLKRDLTIQTIQTEEYTFFYNVYNVLNSSPCVLCPPRITRHTIGKTYGHCDFETYGKTHLLKEHKLFHFAYIGYERVKEKIELHQYSQGWLQKFKESLDRGDKYITIEHPNKFVQAYTVPYTGIYPDYLDPKALSISITK